jgi:CsoR family transcriptional regulator, copper-sensing transcriptional repressor
METKDKDDLRARLKRIAGQVGGIQRMVDEQRSCIDVVMQVNAARAALAKVSRILLHQHLRTSVTRILSTDTENRHLMLDDLLRTLAQSDL